MSSRHLVLAGACVVGVATAVVSAISLFELAVACSIRPPFAAALPVAVDVAGAVGALVWVTETGSARRWGQAIAVASLLLTVAGNGVVHAIAAGLVAVSLGLVLVVGAVIPLSLWGTVHLTALLVGRPTAPTRKRIPPAVPRAAPRPARARRPAPRDAEPAPDTPVPIEAGKLPDRIAVWLLAHRDAGTAEVIAEFGCSEPTVKRARARYRALVAQREALDA